MRPSCSRCKCALPCGISGGASGGCTAGAGMCARTSPGAQGPETTDCWSGLRTDAFGVVVGKVRCAFCSTCEHTRYQNSVLFGRCAAVQVLFRSRIVSFDFKII